MVYTVEIYDTTEYENSITDLKVFKTEKEAKKYIKKEINRWKSYQNDYTKIYLTEWYDWDSKTIKEIKSGSEIMEEIENGGI